MLWLEEDGARSTAPVVGGRDGGLDGGAGLRGVAMGQVGSNAQRQGQRGLHAAL